MIVSDAVPEFVTVTEIEEELPTTTDLNATDGGFKEIAGASPPDGFPDWMLPGEPVTPAQPNWSRSPRKTASATRVEDSLTPVPIETGNADEVAVPPGQLSLMLSQIVLCGYCWEPLVRGTDFGQGATPVP